MRIAFADHHFPHHGGHAGYQMLARYVADQHIHELNLARRLLKFIPDNWLFRFRPFHPNWYNRRAFDLEVQAAAQMVAGSRTVFHFLYGEHSFRWSGKVNRWAGHRNRIIATYHQLPEFFERRRRQYSHLRDLDAIILVASNQREFFESVVGLARVCVIPHGIETDFFRPMGNSERRGCSLCCLTVGSNYRAFDLHVQVIRNINRLPISNVEFVIVGEARCAHYFAGLEKVRYLSGISDEELLRCYAAADLLLLPLVDATACNALLEGMACGLPIVVTDVGGVRDYVDEGCAMLVLGQDSEAMTDRVFTLLADENRRAELGKRARKRAEAQFDWKRIADQVRQLYASVW
jgi:glycosyltransferase involved in cell wall biosynthesis